MGVLENIEIILDRKNGVYFCGEAIKGSLSFKVKQKMKINSIKISINGFAECKWNETSGSVSNRYEGFQQLLKTCSDFLSKENYGDEIYLESGDYSYKFNISLPNGLPTSFKHSDGQISYDLTAVFDAPWSFNQISIKQITLIYLFELNKNLSINNPCSITAKKKYGVLFNKTLPVQVKFKVPKTGFAFGEDIEFTVEVENESSRQIKKMIVILRQKITFWTTNKRKSKQIVKKISQQENNQLIEPAAGYTWKEGKIKLPFLQPSLREGVIHINYDLALIVKSSLFTTNLTTFIPIVIGHVPFNDGAKGANANRTNFEIENLKTNPFE